MASDVQQLCISEHFFPPFSAATYLSADSQPHQLQLLNTFKLCTLLWGSVDHWTLWIGSSTKSGVIAITRYLYWYKYCVNKISLNIMHVQIWHVTNVGMAFVSVNRYAWINYYTGCAEGCLQVLYHILLGACSKSCFRH